MDCLCACVWVTERILRSQIMFFQSSGLQSQLYATPHFMQNDVSTLVFYISSLCNIIINWLPLGKYWYDLIPADPSAKCPVSVFSLWNVGMFSTSFQILFTFICTLKEILLNVCVSVCCVCVILISYIQSLILGHFESCDNIAGRNITNGQRAKALRL